MADRSTVARTLHDVGLAAWFGGSLMGAVGVNGASATVTDPRQRTRVANAGWDRWTPVNLAAIGAHLAGATKLTWDNKGRMGTQKGVLAMSAVKTGLTAAALGVTAYSRKLGKTIEEAGDVPANSGVEPSSATPAEVAKAQKQLKALQWVIPAVTGGLVATTVYAGEQQRPTQVAKGMAARAAQTAKGALKGVEVAGAVKAAKSGARTAGKAARKVA
jgi:hypothetical protein